MYWGYFYFDWTYILVIIGAVICLIASANVNSTYKKYEKVRSRTGLTAEEAARQILAGAGITDVRIERVSGSLTDHYSSKERVLRLSDSTFGSTSVAAIGVAAHECGHAIQHDTGYAPLTLRSISVPLANIGSYLSLPIVIIGLIMGWVGLARVGVFLFAAVVIFQLITLPVEFNASSRAIKILENNRMLETDELTGAKKVLNAAALTYVAALLSSILQLLRLVLLTRRRD
ncbi:MAG: zinc metallopeptidase [Lachnospiraceae bacterium]|nr:zinc metallopeptidase [Lachnospiraceae bacterium]